MDAYGNIHTRIRSGPVVKTFQVAVDHQSYSGGHKKKKKPEPYLASQSCNVST